MTGALRTAINDTEGRRQRAQGAWSSFQENYAADVVVPKFESLYEDVFG